MQVRENSDRHPLTKNVKPQALNDFKNETINSIFLTLQISIASHI